MRVALILYGDLDLISGGFLYDRMLVDYLRGQGEEVEIIALPWCSYARGLLDNLSLVLKRRLENIQADVILQDELAHPSIFGLNRGLCGPGRPPVIAIVHHLRCSEARPAWQNFGYRLVERCYLASVTGFIFNSRTTQESVQKLVGGEKPSVLALPAADRFAVRLTPEDLDARAREPGPLRVLFLGNVIARKGLHTLVEALARLPRESWRLTVVGSLDADPAYAQHIERQIHRAGLGGRVDFAGVLEEEKLAAVLAQSQVLAVPSSYEGYGIVYLEGMAFGLPAVATTAGGAREIITPGWDGFLIAPGDAETLADHLKTLMDDRDLLVSMSLAAQARFAAQPTWKDAGAAVHRFLQSLVG